MDNASESPTIPLPHGVTMRRSPSALLSSSKCAFLLALLIACLFITASPLLAQQAPILVTQAVDNSIRTVLPGNVHPLARAAFDQGEAPSDLLLHRMLLVLKRSDQQETALRLLIENQQYKKSPSYHQWLTPEEFGAHFGPVDSDIAAVTNWLQSSGFQVAQVTKGRTVIEFSGTTGQVKQAFGTAIHKYVVNGEEHWANASNPSIPTALAPVVAGIDSLHNFLKKAQNVYVGKYSEKTKQLTAPNPDYTFGGGCESDGNCYALVPYDFATIYDLLPLWNATPAINGTGVTIAIVGRTDINPADATTFWGLFGLDNVNAPQPTLIITTNGPDPGFTGDEPEADIDTQWSGAAAPGATINFVTSASTETTDGVDLSAIDIVDNNLAPVMSESYGQCEASLGSGGVQFYGLLWEQAAAQGISAMVSSGDNGSAGCDNPNINSPAQFGLNVSGLASTPFNVAVGGTDFNDFNTWSTYWNSSNDPTTQQSVKTNTYIPEFAWNDSCTNPLWVTLGWGANAEAVCNNAQLGDVEPTGGSGGTSAAWVGFKPAWQTGTGVPNDNTRDLPDVSLFASNGFVGSFYVICETDVTGVCDLNNFLGYGGTSVASPAFAGIMALVTQKWGPQGNPDFVLYKLPAKQANAFHDTPSGSTIAMPCVKGSPNCNTTAGDSVGVLSGYSTTAAYDLATGLGSVDAANMVNNWNKVAFTTSTTALTLSVPANTTHGAAVPVTVTVTPASPTASGDVALLVNPGTPGATPPNPAIDWNTLVGGTVSWSTSLLPGGTYKVVAHYAGDTTYGGSYSTPSASITVNPEASSVYMGTPPGVLTQGGYSTSVVYGTGAFDQYLLRADVYSLQTGQCTTIVLGEFACPTGTMTITDNGNPLDGGTFKLNSFGYTEDQGIQLTGGVHTLIAKYNGDPSFNTSSTTATVTVAKATSAISNVSAPSAANTNQQFTVTATVTTITNTSYGLAPTGTVSFFYNATQLLGTVQLTPTPGNVNTRIPATLAASLTTSIPTAGTYNITATYSGDVNYTAVTAGQSNSVQIVVSTPVPDFTIVMTAAPSATFVGQNIVWYGMLTAVNGYNTPVTLTCTAGAPSTCTPSSPVTPTAGGAQFTVTLASNTAGTYNFTISGTDGTLIHATGPQTLTVNADFTVANTGATTQTVMAGVSGVGYAFTVAPKAPATTFGAPVTLACSGLDATTGCVFAINGTAITSIPGTNGSTPVTLTITTSGPNTSGAAVPLRQRADNRLPWLPLTLPIAGVVMLGLAGRRVSRYSAIVGSCLALALLGFMIACGSSSPSISVTNVAPNSVSLWPNNTGWPSSTQPFTATVSNNTAVTWSLSPSGASSGSIDASGNYTAPQVAAGLPPTVNVIATSQVDSTKSNHATVTLKVATVPQTFSNVVVTATDTTTPPTAHPLPALTLVVQ